MPDLRSEGPPFKYKEYIQLKDDWKEIGEIPVQGRTDASCNLKNALEKYSN